MAALCGIILFRRRDGHGRAVPSLRRADLRNERGANLSEAPPASTPLGGSEAKRIGRISVYLCRNQIAMFSKTGEFPGSLQNLFKLRTHFCRSRRGDCLRLGKPRNKRFTDKSE